MSICVVCVTRSRSRYLREALNSCLRQDAQPAEIIVFDNASEDETTTMLEKEFPNVHLIRAHRNIGFFPALNIAIANTDCKYVFTIDDDATLLQDDAFRLMLDEMEREPRIAILTCNIEGPREAPALETDAYVKGFKTGFSLIRIDVFRKYVGYYPDAFFRSGGENYLATKVWDQGFRVKQLARVRMYHHQTPTGRETRQQFFHGIRSQNLVVIMREHWLMVVPRLAVKFANGLIFSLRRPRTLGWWAQAWISTFLNIGVALKLRDPIRWKSHKLLRSLDRKASIEVPPGW